MSVLHASRMQKLKTTTFTRSPQSHAQLLVAQPRPSWTSAHLLKVGLARLELKVPKRSERDVNHGEEQVFSLVSVGVSLLQAVPSPQRLEGIRVHAGELGIRVL